MPSGETIMKEYKEYNLIYNGLRAGEYTDDEIILIMEKFQAQTVSDYINVLQEVQEEVINRMEKL
jgi:hypothetical protein